MCRQCGGPQRRVEGAWVLKFTAKPLRVQLPLCERTCFPRLEGSVICTHVHLDKSGKNTETPLGKKAQSVEQLGGGREGLLVPQECLVRRSQSCLVTVPIPDLPPPPRCPCTHASSEGKQAGSEVSRPLGLLQEAGRMRWSVAPGGDPCSLSHQNCKCP